MSLKDVKKKAAASPDNVPAVQNAEPAATPILGAPAAGVVTDNEPKNASGILVALFVLGLVVVSLGNAMNWKIFTWLLGGPFQDLGRWIFAVLPGEGLYSWQIAGLVVMVFTLGGSVGISIGRLANRS